MTGLLYHTREVLFTVFHYIKLYNWSLVSDNDIVKYSGTSLIRSPMGLGKSDLNGEATVLQRAKLHCGIQFRTEQG